jgi:GNAT superfamily N-acetyltransferase
MMTEIRHATPDDIEQLVEMGEQFFEESPFRSISTWDAGSFQLTVMSLLSGSTQGGLLVAEDGGKLAGMAAYVIFPLYFNLQTKLAQEVFWFCKPAHRRGLGGALLSELEQDALKNGAQVFISANLAGERDEAFTRLYQRRGYAPTENVFMRKLAS